MQSCLVQKSLPIKCLFSFLDFILLSKMESKEKEYSPLNGQIKVGVCNFILKVSARIAIETEILVKCTLVAKTNSDIICCIC